MKPLPFKMGRYTSMEEYRAATWATKEPETIEWIRGFAPWGVFFDVGANIGVFSLFAASQFPEMEIISFEPMKANFRELMSNRNVNRFDNMICLQYAIGNSSGWTELFVPDETSGASGAQMGLSSGFINQVLVRRIDDLLEFPKPDHIKIDIDGQEVEIIRGMVKTLPFIKSILIEVRPESKVTIVGFLTAAGFTMDNRFNTMSPHSRERRAAEGIPDENIVFTR